MAENIELFDTSNFGQIHPLYTKTNHRILGKFKNETGRLRLSNLLGSGQKCIPYWSHKITKSAKSELRG